MGPGRSPTDFEARIKAGVALCQFYEYADNQNDPLESEVCLADVPDNYREADDQIPGNSLEAIFVSREQTAKQNPSKSRYTNSDAEAQA